LFRCVSQALVMQVETAFAGRARARPTLLGATLLWALAAALRFAFR
jgi:hypothetical protein